MRLPVCQKGVGPRIKQLFLLENVIIVLGDHDVSISMFRMKDVLLLFYLTNFITASNQCRKLSKWRKPVALVENARNIVKMSPVSTMVRG